MAKKLTPITPGDVLLEEFLQPMGISQTQTLLIQPVTMRVMQFIGENQQLISWIGLP